MFMAVHRCNGKIHFRGDWQVYPGAGYVLAFPNPHGSTGFGAEFTKDISTGWDGNVYNDVMKVMDRLQNLPYIDKNRMGAMGMVIRRILYESASSKRE